MTIYERVNSVFHPCNIQKKNQKLKKKVRFLFEKKFYKNFRTKNNFWKIFEFLKIWKKISFLKILIFFFEIKILEKKSYIFLKNNFWKKNIIFEKSDFF